MYDWLIPIFLWFNTTGVTDYVPHDRNTYKMQIAVTGSFETNSNAVNAEMLRFFLAGRYIDNDMKDRSLKRMRDINRLGMDINADISFFHKPDSGLGKNWSYGINLGQRFLFGGQFSKDTYKLGFYGNAPYAGETLELGKLNARFLSYQYISLGFVKEFKGEKWHKSLGFGLGLANANQFFSLSVPRGTLFTEQDGKYLDLDASYRISSNDASKNRYFYPNGFGLSGSLEFSMTDRKRHAFYLKATNFGVMRFNSFSNSRSLDTSLTFNGVEVDNVFGMNGDYLQNTLDSLATNFGGNVARGAELLPMPGTIEMGYSYTAIPRKLYLSALVDYTYFPGYVPRGTIRVTGVPDPFVSITGTFGYGGFGGFNGGVDLGFHFGEGWHFMLGTKSIQGIVAERTTSGLSGHAGIIKRFGKRNNVNDEKK